MKWTLTFEGERGGEGGWYCPAYNHDYECCEHKDSPAKDKPCPGLGNEGCPAVPAPEPSKVEPWVAVPLELKRLNNPRFLLDILELVKMRQWILLQEKMKRVRKGKEDDAVKLLSAKQSSEFEKPDDYTFYRELLRSDIDEMRRLIAWQLDIQDLLNFQIAALPPAPEEDGK